MERVMIDNDMLLNIHDEEGDLEVIVFAEDGEDEPRKGDVRKIQGREYWVMDVGTKQYKGREFKSLNLHRIAWN